MSAFQRSLRDRVTLLKAPPLTTGYGGQQVRDWETATPVPNVPALVKPESSTENTDARQTTITRWRLFLGPAHALEAVDRVKWDGDDLEVDGDVEEHRRNGVVHHFEAVLKRVQEG